MNSFVAPKRLSHPRRSARQKLKHRPQAVTPAGGDQRLVEPLRERHDRYRVQVQKCQISERRRQTLRVQEFRFSGAFAVHRFTAVQQDPHGNMQLGLVIFMKSFPSRR